MGSLTLKAMMAQVLFLCFCYFALNIVWNIEQHAILIIINIQPYALITESCPDALCSSRGLVEVSARPLPSKLPGTVPMWS